MNADQNKFLFLLSVILVTILITEPHESYARPLSSTYDWVKVDASSALDQTVAQNWITALDEAIDYLPEDVVKIIRGQSGLNITIITESNSCVNGYANGGGVAFNTKPADTGCPFNWIPLIQDGFSHNEMVYVALHELAHYYFFYSTEDGKTLKAFLETVAERGAIEPGGEKIVWRELPATIYPILTPGWQIHEDVAEAFSIYVMWPDILKKNHPIRYAFMKKVFGREYFLRVPMPDSIKSRLTYNPNKR